MPQSMAQPMAQAMAQAGMQKPGFDRAPNPYAQKPVQRLMQPLDPYAQKPVQRLVQPLDPRARYMGNDMLPPYRGMNRSYPQAYK